MDFEVRYGYHSDWLDPMLVLYNKTEMKRTDSAKVDRAFRNSFLVVSAWVNSRIIGIGRMISDGEMYSGIFDVVVDTDIHRSGVGRAIMQALIMKTPEAFIHLTSTIGNEEFYLKLGFKKHRTGLALYPPSLHPSRYLDYNWKPDK